MYLSLSQKARPTGQSQSQISKIKHLTTWQRHKAPRHTSFQWQIEEDLTLAPTERSEGYGLSKSTFGTNHPYSSTFQASSVNEATYDCHGTNSYISHTVGGTTPPNVAYPTHKATTHGEILKDCLHCQGLPHHMPYTVAVRSSNMCWQGSDRLRLSNFSRHTWSPSA